MPISLSGDKRGKSHVLFYMWEEITWFMLVFINSLKINCKPPPLKYHLALKTEYTAVSLGCWRGKVEPEELNSLS